MFKLNSWLTGLVILTIVIAAIFGATYVIAQSDFAQSIDMAGMRDRGGELREGDFPDEFGEEGQMIDRGRQFGGERHGSEGRIDLVRGLGSLTMNLFKIGLVIVFVGFVIPAISVYRHHRRKKEFATG